MNDGLVSNTSLILGVAGASHDPHTVLLTGLAGLCAGACSMAAGEYLSMRSQRELFEYQIGLEQDELAEYPEAEAEELALIYEARGLTLEAARGFARQIIADPRRALDTLAREELGLNPEELGSPLGAALFSFAAFGLGAAIPLLPFVLLAHHRALLVSAGLSGVSLFGVGAALSLFTGRSLLLSGLRMLAIGAAAGLTTWLIGSWFGVSVA
ncbi:MAG: VIT1/CCC1 transporter family protein [Planctomycetota bacterium]